MKQLKLALILICLPQLFCASEEAPPPQPIKDFSVANQSEVWAITAKGKILHFSNGDLVKEKTNVKSTVTQIYFLNAAHGWILDADAWIWSTDNGKDWQKRGRIEDASSAGLSSQLIFANERVGWLVTTFDVWLTEDGGATWKSMYPNRDISYEPQPISYFPVDDNIGWLAMTGAKILKTVDRGNSWTIVRLPGNFDNGAFYSTNESKCLVGAENGGGLFYTNDGGKNWKQLLGDNERKDLGIFSLSFPTSEIGWLAGIEYANLGSKKEAVGVLFKSADGGMTWVRLDHGLNEKWFRWIKFTDSQNGWLGSDKSLYRTTNGGNSWHKFFEIN